MCDSEPDSVPMERSLTHMTAVLLCVTCSDMDSTPMLRSRRTAGTARLLSYFCSTVLLLLLGLSSTALHTHAQSSSARPSVAWLHVAPSISNGQAPDASIPSRTPPSARCAHSFVQVSMALAKRMRPDYPWREGGSADGEWTSSIAFTLGGRSSGGAALGDAWLLQVDSSSFTSVADWVAAPAVPTPRFGYRLQFVRTTGALMVVGGENEHGVLWDSSYQFTENSATATWRAFNVSADENGRGAVPHSSGSAEWAQFNNGAGEQFLLFGDGPSTADVTLTTPSPSAELWTMTPPALEFPGSWSMPETDVTCTTSVTVCPDARTFAQLFPQLDNSTLPILRDFFSEAATLRPSATLQALQQLQSLATQLDNDLQSPAVTNFAATHSSIDELCVMGCSQLSSAQSASRPSAREGHGLSVLDWIDPSTGMRRLEAILFGGRTSCAEGAKGGNECFDADLYFLDLRTWVWTVRRAPDLSTVMQPGASQRWPGRRAFHSQRLYTTRTSAQLWIQGGLYTDAAGTTIPLNDAAMFDLVTQRWWLTQQEGAMSGGSSSVSSEGFLDSFGRSEDRQPAAHQASFIVGDTMWIHGGCVATSTNSGSDALTPIADTDLWVLKIGARVLARNWRVSNDVPDAPLGQGLTTAQPGPLYDAQGNLYRFNYFHLKLHVNYGTIPQGVAANSSLAVYNRALVGTPRTNSTALPWWGYPISYAGGLASRLSVLLVSNFVDRPGSATPLPVASAVPGVSSDILTMRGNPGYPMQSPGTLDSQTVYTMQYSITEGSKYEVYVAYDGEDVPGSPFHLSLESGPASGENSRPAPVERGIPPIKTDPATGEILSQVYGNKELAQPVVRNGLGLVKVIRGAPASFLLQIVDIYLNPWTDSRAGVSAAAQQGAVVIELALVDPDSGALMRNMSLQEYNYINNDDGTYTVTYMAPDVGSFGLGVSVNGQRISMNGAHTRAAGGSNSNSWAKVAGIQPLELSELQMIGMLSFSCVISAVCVGCFIFFLIRWRHPMQRSRSLLFDFFFTLGCCLSTGAILEQTNYSHGTRIGSDQRARVDSHNACQLHSLLIGMAVVLCFGSLYANVVRARYIEESIRKSISARGRSGSGALDAEDDVFAATEDYTIILSSDAANGMPTTPLAPLPRIPNVPSDWTVARPVLLLLVAELAFQAIWVVASPMEPEVAVARDNFRSYVVCATHRVRVWVYLSLGLKGVAAAWMLYWTSSGRSVRDPLGEARHTSWVSWNMAFSSMVAVGLVFPLDAQDSIKTSFVVSTFAVCWSMVLQVGLIFLPRAVTMHRTNPDPQWYDKFIIALQDEEREARARQEKEDREARMSGGALSTAHSPVGFSPTGPSSSGTLRAAGGRQVGAQGSVRQPRPLPKSSTPAARATALSLALQAEESAFDGPISPSVAPPSSSSMHGVMPSPSVHGADDHRWRNESAHADKIIHE